MDHGGLQELVAQRQRWVSGMGRGGQVQFHPSDAKRRKTILLPFDFRVSVGRQ